VDARHGCCQDGPIVPDAASSLLEVVLGQDAANRVALEGVRLVVQPDGALEVAMRKLEASALLLKSGPLTFHVGRLALHELVAQVRMEQGAPRLLALQAAAAELSGVKADGPLVYKGIPKGEFAWSLAPLAAAEGKVRADIKDAHLMFDADVTVPIRQGQVDFNAATVEHVGPDSRMGVSPAGVYVDAPNGRSHVYQFPPAPLAGVEFERRGLGPWVSDRGRLRLQAFAESLLVHVRSGHKLGLTAQTRELLARTWLSGEVQLGDGKFAVPGVRADLAGRAQGSNLVRVLSEAVARGLTLEMAALSARHASLQEGGIQLGCDTVTGAFMFRVSVEGTAMRFACNLAELKLAGLRFARPAP
jgi:hypothetical protein